jgi:putative endonuclease
MDWVYILRGSTGRHYIGSTINLERRLSEHRSGGTHTTQRLGEQLETVSVLELATIEQARILERQLKRKKNPKLAIAMLEHLRPPSDQA